MTTMITLKKICAELKVDPREARERLRLAVKNPKKYPALAKDRKPGEAWEWPDKSAALTEAKKAVQEA